MRTIPYLALIIFFAAALPRLEAGTVFPNCQPDTLQHYESIQGCIVGGSTGGVLVFGGFSFVPSASSGTTLSAAQITVTPIQQGLGGGFNFGGFTAGPALPGQDVTYILDYFFEIDPGPVSSGADMGMDPPFGNVLITQAVCADLSLFPGRQTTPTCQSPNINFAQTFPAQTFSVDNTNPPASWFAHKDFNPPVLNFANVQTTFLLNGARTGAGFDSLTSTYAVVAVPEPLTSLMGLGGLIALGFLRRYRKSG